MLLLKAKLEREKLREKSRWLEFKMQEREGVDEECKCLRGGL